MTSSEQDFRTRPRRAQWDLFGVGLLLLGFLVLVFVGWALRSNRATRDQAAASVDRARRDLHDLERLVKDASGGRGAERVARASLVGRVPPRRLTEEIAALLSDGARVDSVQLTYGKTLAVRISFSTKDASVYDSLLARLRASRSLIVRGMGSERRAGEMRGRVTLEWHEPERAAP